MKKTCNECEKQKFVLPYEYLANPLTVVEEGGDWIQGAIKHPGRCTPGSPNYDCPKGSPQWNLAQRFKHGDLHKAQQGGEQEQIMQVITMYAQLHNTKPEVIIQKLQQLDENDQQQALESMVAELQQSGGAQQQPQQQPQQQQQSAPMSYADTSESPEMESYAYGGGYGAYGARGAVGLGEGIPYAVPAINNIASNSDGLMSEPVSAVTGALGLMSSLAGSVLGFGKAANWLGNKIKPGSNILQDTNNRLRNVVDFGTDLSYTPNRQVQDPYRPLDKKYIRQDRRNINPIKYSDAVMTDYTKMPQYDNNPKYDGTMVAEYGGDLPKAQFGLKNTQGAPYAQQNNTPDPNEFPQNKTVDAKARLEGSLIYNKYNNAIRSFANPFDINNMSELELNNFNNNKKPFAKPAIDTSDPEMPDLSGLQPNLSQQQQMDQNAADSLYNVNQNRAITEDQSVFDNSSENKKQDANNLGSFNGMEYVQKSLAGLGAFNSFLQRKEQKRQKREYDAMLKRLGNTDSRLATNSKNPFGNYTLNVGPANNFQLGMTTPVQDYGTTARYGGSMKQSYKQGGEYQVSEDELLQLMQQGAEIEFINK
jgi:hypothetical protein